MKYAQKSKSNQKFINFLFGSDFGKSNLKKHLKIFIAVIIIFTFIIIIT